MRVFRPVSYIEDPLLSRHNMKSIRDRRSDARSAAMLSRLKRIVLMASRTPRLFKRNGSNARKLERTKGVSVMSLNRATVIGNLGGDPELRHGSQS